MKRPVIQVCSAKSLGGGEVHVADLCRQLVAQGFEVHLAHRAKSRLADELAGSGVRPHPIAPRNSLDLWGAWRLARLAATTGAGIVHAHMGRDYFPSGIAVRLARFFGGPARLVLTRHHLNRVKSNPAQRWALGRDCRIIAVSEAVKRSLAASHDFFRPRTVVIPNWLRSGKSPATRVAAPDAGDRISVACIGSISPIKDQLTFVRAAKALAAGPDGSRFRFLIVGEPGHSKADRDYDALVRAEAAGVGAIVFAGNIPDVSRRMGEFDIVAITSRAEAFSLVLVEAMDAGCAVVASRVGAIEEILDTPETGITFESCDDRSLAEAIGKLAGDAGLRRAIGERAVASVRARFDREKVIARIIALYREAPVANPPEETPCR